MNDAGNDAPVSEATMNYQAGSVAVLPRRARRLEIWLPFAIVTLDQIAKAIVRAELSLYSTVPVIPGLLNLTHVRNTGAAFGFLNSADFPLKTLLLAAIAMAALIGVGAYAA